MSTGVPLLVSKSKNNVGPVLGKTFRHIFLGSLWPRITFLRPISNSCPKSAWKRQEESNKACTFTTCLTENLKNPASRNWLGTARLDLVLTTIQRHRESSTAQVSAPLCKRGRLWRLSPNAQHPLPRGLLGLPSQRRTGAESGGKQTPPGPRRAPGSHPSPSLGDLDGTPPSFGIRAPAARLFHCSGGEDLKAPERSCERTGLPGSASGPDGARAACGWRQRGGPLPAAAPLLPQLLRFRDLRIPGPPSSHLSQAASAVRQSPNPGAEACWAGGDAGSSGYG